MESRAALSATDKRPVMYSLKDATGVAGCEDPALGITQIAANC